MRPSSESAFVHVACEDRVFTISPGLLGSIKVKRDMEVVRKVLRAIEAKPDLKHAPLTVDGLDDITVSHHVALLHSAGYIDALVSHSIGRTIPHILVRDLTWEGHEFVASLHADESTWQRIKETLGPDNLSRMSLKTIQDITTKAVTAWALRQLGL